MTKANDKPTIIKRKKVVAGGGHHGGAWKVAIIVGPSKGALRRVGS
jgi:chemotaxis protein MotB